MAASARTDFRAASSAARAEARRGRSLRDRHSPRCHYSIVEFSDVALAAIARRSAISLAVENDRQTTNLGLRLNSIYNPHRGATRRHLGTETAQIGLSET